MVFVSWSLLTTYVSLLTSNSRPVYRKYFDLQVCLRDVGFTQRYKWSTSARGTAEGEGKLVKTPFLVLPGET